MQQAVRAGAANLPSAPTDLRPVSDALNPLVAVQMLAPRLASRPLATAWVAATFRDDRTTWVPSDLVRVADAGACRACDLEVVPLDWATRPRLSRHHHRLDVLFVAELLRYTPSRRRTDLLHALTKPSLPPALTVRGQYDVTDPCSTCSSRCPPPGPNGAVPASCVCGPRGTMTWACRPHTISTACVRPRA